MTTAMNDKILVDRKMLEQVMDVINTASFLIDRSTYRINGASATVHSLEVAANKLRVLLYTHNTDKETKCDCTGQCKQWWSASDEVSRECKAVFP